MVIKPKFKLDQYVYLAQGTKIEEAKILERRIYITQNKDGEKITILYAIVLSCTYRPIDNVKEEKLFESKARLFKYYD